MALWHFRLTKQPDNHSPLLLLCPLLTLNQIHHAILTDPSIKSQKCHSYFFRGHSVTLCNHLLLLLLLLLPILYLRLQRYISRNKTRFRDGQREDDEIPRQIRLNEDHLRSNDRLLSRIQDELQRRWPGSRFRGFLNLHKRLLDEVTGSIFLSLPQVV